VAELADAEDSKSSAVHSACGFDSLHGHQLNQRLTGDEAEQHAYITNLYVEPAFRGGTGGRLLAAVMEWCRARAMDSAILWPTDDSRSLYARHGFHVSGDVLDVRITPLPAPLRRSRGKRLT